jgi:hypothetical protein
MWFAVAAMAAWIAARPPPPGIPRIISEYPGITEKTPKYVWESNGRRMGKP